MLFERVIEASATPLCDVIRTKWKNFSLVENCMLFKTIRSAFILTLVVLLKKSRILYPKRHGIFHSKALHMPCREWWSMRTRSQWGKILLVFWTMPICVSHDETHSSAKTFQTKDEWGRKQFVLVKTKGKGTSQSARTIKGERNRLKAMVDYKLMVGKSLLTTPPFRTLRK